MKRKIGVVTIGESPRPDILVDIKPLLGESVDVFEKGALDGLNSDQVKKLLPENDMTPLSTRMNDGTVVVVAEEKILPKIQASIDALNEHEVSIIVILCVSAFPRFESKCMVIKPQQVIDRCVEALIGKEHHLGIIVPMHEQEDSVRLHFSHVTDRIDLTVVSPDAGRKDLSRASEMFREVNCDLILMYCMGYKQDFGREIRRLTGRPVLVANTLVARVIGELLE